MKRLLIGALALAGMTAAAPAATAQGGWRTTDAGVYGKFDNTIKRCLASAVGIGPDGTQLHVLVGVSRMPDQPLQMDVSVHDMVGKQFVVISGLVDDAGDDHADYQTWQPRGEYQMYVFKYGARSQQLVAGIGHTGHFSVIYSYGREYQRADFDLTAAGSNMSKWPPLSSTPAGNPAAFSRCLAQLGPAP